MPLQCIECGEVISPGREALGYRTCLECGDKRAKNVRKHWTIVPAGPKQGYTRVTNKADLVGIYKGSTIRE